MDLSDAKRLKVREEEKAKLKRLSADAMLDNAGLKDLLTKNGDARRQAGSQHGSSGRSLGVSERRARARSAIAPRRR